MNSSMVWLLVLISLLFSCANTAEESSKEVDKIDSVRILKTVFDLEPVLTGADSVQIIYYNDPDGDSLRYSRHFTFTQSADSSLVQPILREMNQMYSQESTIRRCRSIGKLFLLKEEEVLKTVYFSNRGGSCSYFYFINNGAFVYFPLTDVAADLLAANKKKARKP